MMRFVFLLVAVFGVYCPVSLAYDVTGTLVEAVTFSAGYCEIVTPCGPLGLYVEDMYEVNEPEESGDLITTDHSTRVEIYIDTEVCGEGLTVLAFDITPRKKARPKYQANPFAQSASLTMKGTTKDLPTQTSYTVNNLTVTWNGGDIPQMIHSSTLNDDGSVEACQSFITFPEAFLVSLRINGTELFWEDISCDSTFRFNENCSILMPE